MHAGSGRPILVVDDEPSIRDAVATALRYEGFNVGEAGDGMEALLAVRRREPDLIVLDWMLPDLNGGQVSRRLREEGFKNPILFMTADDPGEHQLEASHVGSAGYITKPFSLAEIVSRIQAILRLTPALR